MAGPSGMPMRNGSGYGIVFFTFVLFIFSLFLTFVRIRFAVAEIDDSILSDGSPLWLSDDDSDEDNTVMGHSRRQRRDIFDRDVYSISQQVIVIFTH